MGVGGRTDGRRQAQSMACACCCGMHFTITGCSISRGFPTSSKTFCLPPDSSTLRLFWNESWSLKWHHNPFCHFHHGFLCLILFLGWLSFSSSPTPSDLSFSIKRGDIVLSPFSSQVLAHTMIRTSSLECVILAPQIWHCFSWVCQHEESTDSGATTQIFNTRLFLSLMLLLIIQ